VVKICSKCKIKKNINEFCKNKALKDGKNGVCKKCNNKYNTKYRKNNRDKLIQLNKDWRHRNIEEQRKREREWNRNNPEKIQKYKEENKERLNKWRKKYLYEKYHNDIKHRIRMVISTAVKRGLKNGKEGKSWKDILPYSTEELIIHLESLFQEGMTWTNYGKWHIDHIKPVSLFEFTNYSDDQFKECWKLENLQPLWAYDNLSKGNKYELQKLYK